ncbi:MAG: TIGR03663 family protein, partial [Verrucomicrobia bacterium]|nr:TIGR03663 family protein [Verrucomicrobiota bacterium]
MPDDKLHSSSALRPAALWLLVILVAAGALALRLPRLGERPMHTDEAVHAVKFGTLLETGQLHYDPREYHGTTLHYLTLPVAWLRGAHKLAGINEADLRIVTVIGGIALILLLPLVANGLGRWATMVAALLTCLSPAMVYYSRYYVQEILFVLFTFLMLAAGWRYVHTRRAGWAIVVGLGAGLMFATKETCVYSWLAMFVGVLVARGRGGLRAVRMPAGHALASAVVAFAAAELFFTCCFTYWPGLLDSFRAYGLYLHRASGTGHEKPWYYFFQLLAWTRQGGFVWSEALILGLAVCGAVAALRKRDGDGQRPALPMFLLGYAAVQIAIITLVPYKTPWLALSFLFAAILLAGYGAEQLVRGLARRRLGWLAVLVIAAGAAQLGAQAWRGAVLFGADERNPYVYSHSTPDVLNLARNIREAAAHHPDGMRMT